MLTKFADKLDRELRSRRTIVGQFQLDARRPDQPNRQAQQGRDNAQNGQGGEAPLDAWPQAPRERQGLRQEPHGAPRAAHHPAKNASGCRRQSGQALLVFCGGMIFLGKPVSTPDRVRGGLFRIMPKRKLRLPAIRNMHPIAVRTEARIVRTGLRPTGGKRAFGSQAGF